MSRDEVDGCHGPAPRVLVEVRRTGQPRCELAEGRRLAAPEVAHRVAVLAVPLRPLRREVADLIAARPHVPGLRDQLHLRDHRVLLHQLEEGGEAVHLVELAREGRRQVEAEPVHVHLEHPVPQRIHDELQRVRIADVQAVAGARVVGVVPLVVILEPVVRLVVDAAHRQGRTEMAALGGVVVDHVEDHLDAGRVQGLDHRLELLHLLAALPAGGVGVLRGEEGDGVVAPVVREALLLETRVVDELMHRHELDRRHAELLEMLDDRGMGDRAVSAADLFGDGGVQLRQSPHVGLVDEGLRVRRLGLAVAAPVEVRVHDDTHHLVGRRVLVVARVGLPEVVAEHRLSPLHLSLDGLRVRVEHQFVRVEPLAAGGVVLAVDPISVALPRLDRGQVAVVDEGVDIDEIDARLGAVVVEEAELHAFGALAEQGEVGAAAIERRPQRVRGTWPDLHATSIRRGLHPSERGRTAARGGARRTRHDMRSARPVLTPRRGGL